MLDNLGNLERTHSCGQLRAQDIGKQVVLMGWVAKRRDFGELTFVDLRDRDGITQVVFNAEDAPEAHTKAKDLRGEYVIAVGGEVLARAENTRNPKLATGDVEVRARELLILNDARTPPFQLDAAPDALASEDLRLKYRYLDLRRPQLQSNLLLRHRVTNEIRRYMSAQGFTEIETPIMIKSTPEGARDYIVPSRIFPGKFFALPQSPQLFKQLCMIGGLDKYFQIAHCFRDEDLRADRQPEFTQLDVEMSFATLDQIYRLIEGLFASVFKLINVDLPVPFPRFTFEEVMRRFGSDKPDLRIQGMELQDLAPAVEGTDFPPFASALSSGGQVKGIVVPGGANLSRKVLDELQEFAKRYGAGALAWIKLGDETTSSLLKALGADVVARMADVAGAKKGDAVLIVSGKPKIVAASLGALRNEIAKRENLIPANVYAPLWVTDFPMFEFHEEDGRYYSMHHPFTSPVDEISSCCNERSKVVKQICSDRFERKLTIRYQWRGDGEWLDSYSSSRRAASRLQSARNEHRRSARAIRFLPRRARIWHAATRRHRAGYRSTDDGLAGTDNIRDVIAFPKTASAADLMIDAPGEVDPKLLEELHLRVVED